jgi:hypothetical protein
VTVYTPTVPEQDNVEVPDVPRATLVGVIAQVRPVAGDTVTARFTVPVKPWTEVTVIVDVPLAPARTVTLVKLAENVKSLIV